jgi:hypothetical protein
LGVWCCLQRQQLAAEVKGGNSRLCNRRLWRQAAAAVAVAAALAAAVEADGYGGDGRLWRRRNKQRQQSQCVFVCVCASCLQKIWLASCLLRCRLYGHNGAIKFAPEGGPDLALWTAQDFVLRSL